MNEFTSGDFTLEETTETLLLKVDDLPISSGVMIGVSTAGIALILSIALINLISFIRRS